MGELIEGYPQFGFRLENHGITLLKRLLRDEIIDDFFRDGLPIDDYEVDVNARHSRERHADRTIKEGDLMCLQQVGYRIGRPETELRR